MCGWVGAEEDETSCIRSRELNQKDGDDTAKCVSNVVLSKVAKCGVANANAKKRDGMTVYDHVVWFEKEIV